MGNETNNPNRSRIGTIQAEEVHLTENNLGSFTTRYPRVENCLNLKPETIYRFITGDFSSLWDSLALNPNPSNDGNFTFALLDMILLEFIATYCKGDNSGSALKDFSRELNSIETRYFSEISNFKGNKSVMKLGLPTINGKNNELIHVLFDLIRNGQAHQYQQILADLKDQRLIISISGRVGVPGRTEGLLLREVKKLQIRDGHLNFTVGQACISVSFRPEIFFLDITKAVEETEILERRFSFNHFNRQNSSYSSMSSRDFDSIQKQE